MKIIINSTVAEKSINNKEKGGLITLVRIEQ